MTLIDIANILIYISGSVWACELIPQIYKTLKTKRVNDISPIYFAMSFIAYIMYIFANIVLKNWPIVFSHIPGLCATLVMIFFMFKYRSKS